MEIKEALQEPLKDLNSNNVQDVFEKIAKNLFNNFCIQCGCTKYYFAEIEFYYYDKNKFDKEWNEKTYPRTNKEAGMFFFHYSGVDICFDSDFSKGVFGGILIRSLYDKDRDKFIMGPLLCVNEMLNTCSVEKKWPEIIRKEENSKCQIAKTERFGISYSEEHSQGEPLCFYDIRLDNKENRKNTIQNASWDFSKKEAKDLNRYYQRF
ncbi:MAG: hypothetical protein K6G73_12800 [Marinilabiliaceae bacterium]|nr:hypothetical protein [Marinilabiliaceae bacterium]